MFSCLCKFFKTFFEKKIIFFLYFTFSFYFCIMFIASNKLSRESFWGLINFSQNFMFFVNNRYIYKSTKIIFLNKEMSGQWYTYSLLIFFFFLFLCFVFDKQLTNATFITFSQQFHNESKVVIWFGSNLGSPLTLFFAFQ